MALADEGRAKGRDGMEFGEVGQVLIEDWEVDVEQMIRRGGNVVVEPAIEVDDRINAVAIECRPIGDCRRDEKKSFVVHLK